MKFNTFIFMSMLLLFFSCSSVMKLDSFKDPDYNQTTFDNILIQVDSNEISTRKSVEDNANKNFELKGIKSLQSYKILYPTRSYTDNETRYISLGKRIPAILKINIIESGYSDQKPHFNIRMEIIDVTNGKIVWTADGYNGGNGLDDLDYIYNKFFQRLATKLIEEKIISTIN